MTVYNGKPPSLSHALGGALAASLVLFTLLGTYPGRIGPPRVRTIPKISQNGDAQPCPALRSLARLAPPRPGRFGLVTATAYSTALDSASLRDHERVTPRLRIPVSCSQDNHLLSGNMNMPLRKGGLGPLAHHASPLAAEVSHCCLALTNSGLCPTPPGVSGAAPPSTPTADVSLPSPAFRWSLFTPPLFSFAFAAPSLRDCLQSTRASQGFGAPTAPSQPLEANTEVLADGRGLSATSAAWTLGQTAVDAFNTTFNGTTDPGLAACHDLYSSVHPREYAQTALRWAGAVGHELAIGISVLMGIFFLLFITCAIFVGLVTSVIDHGLSPAQMIAYAWRALLVSTEFLIHGLMEAVAILLSVLLIFGRPIVCIGLFAAAIESTMAMQTMSAKDGERWTIFDGKRSNWLPWVNAILGLLMFKIPDLVPYFREEMIKPELLTLEEARVLATESLGTWDLLHARPVAPTAPAPRPATRGATAEGDGADDAAAAVANHHRALAEYADALEEWEAGRAAHEERIESKTAELMEENVKIELNMMPETASTSAS